MTLQRFSWLDFKLGLRMLVKYPVLTVVGGLAIAFAIWAGAGTFEFVSQLLFPRLPLPEGDRIVGIQNYDVAASRANHRVLHDLVTWREELTTIEEIGAFRTVERNLVTGEGIGAPVEVAEIAAAGFGIAAVPPLHGRALLAADEQPGAPAVAVLGYDVWQSRFNADPAVVGRVIRLGSATTTIVGVMPEGFGFPIAQRLWTPLRLDPLDYARGEGPSLRVFGRLAAGVTLDEAQSELTALGQRAAADHPDTHAHLQPRVLPYARSILGLSGPLFLAGASSINLVAVLVLLLICGNVALLMFARAATRESELVVRSALGASRGRIVAQLFTESLVLSMLAAAVGLACAGAGLRWGQRIVESAILDGERLPFWFRGTLSSATVLYALLLTLLVAVITGVVPAMKATGRRVGTQLRQVGAGAGGFHFGGMWTAVIVLQVAAMIALPVIGLVLYRDTVTIRSKDPGFPAEQYLAARIEMDRESSASVGDTSQAQFHARYDAALRELERRLEMDPAVAAVTWGERLPLMYHPHRRVDVEGGGAALTEAELYQFGDPAAEGYRVSSAQVALDFFDALDADVLNGRAFHSGDLATDAHTVIVNESFVRRVLGERNPIGRRIRYRFFEERRGDPTFDAAQEPWYEIIGVVPDLATTLGTLDMKSAAIYHPATTASVYPVSAAIHVPGSTRDFARRVRTVAADIDPALRLYGVAPLSETVDVEVEFLTFWFRLVLMVSTIALVLSLTGVYAVTAYTVARRTREIGIRVALGADARRIVLTIFRRPLVQVVCGLALGVLIIGGLFNAAAGYISLRGVLVMIAYALVMLAVCVLACAAPTRRALRVQPTEAMRIDG